MPNRPIAAVKLLVALAFGLVASPAFAGFMVFANDTDKTILVQEVVTVNNQTRLGKVMRLFNGEALRDSLNCPNGVRKFSFYDSPTAKVPLLTESFPCPKKDENVVYSIQSDGKGGIKIVPAKVTVNEDAPSILPPSTMKQP